jgi:hypothetical protein
MLISISLFSISLIKEYLPYPRHEVFGGIYLIAWNSGRPGVVINYALCIQ